MDRMEIPNIRRLLKRLRGKSVYTSLDLKSGYHQMKIKKGSRKYFCFTWKGKQYRFRGAPFGLHFLPSKFHRIMSHLFADLDDVTVYIDDILIASVSVEKHKEVVEEVIKRLNKANLKLNLEKCKWGVESVIFLGFKISKDGVEIDPQKQERLLQIRIPETGKDIRQFLGAMNYLREHLPEYGKIAGPLYELQNVKILKNNETWRERGLDAFIKLKELLHSPETLQQPLEDVKYELETDASKYGFGGCLFQTCPKSGKKRIIQLFSGAFKKAQKDYSIPKKELFAI
eukprot:Awhi_evm1s9735